MCGNLSGKVDGMIKDCNTAAFNIIEALVEKLQTTGDVSHLKTEFEAKRRSCCGKEENYQTRSGNWRFKKKHN